MDAVEREHAAMSSRAFATERLGIGDWPRTDMAAGRVISPEAWSACLDREATGRGLPALAFDVSPQRDRAAIAAATQCARDRFLVEVIDCREGTGWLVPRLEELCRRHRPRTVVADQRSPAAAFLSALDAYARP